MKVSKLARALALALLVGLTATTVSQAGLITTSSTLDQLMLDPNSGVGVNGFEFTGFRLTPSASPNSNKPIAPENLSVTAIPVAGDKVELLFQFPGVWNQQDFAEMVLAFEALAPDGYAFTQQSLSFGPGFLGDASGNPYALINETVMPTDPNSTQSPFNLLVYSDPDPTHDQLMDSQDIVTPSVSLDISKDIQISGGSSQDWTLVALTDFSQTFMVERIVPEPGSMMLVLAGGVAIVFGRRRK